MSGSPHETAAFRHHLDNAAASFPKPEPVVAAVLAALAMPGNPGRGSGGAARAAERALEGAREVVAGFLGASSAARVAFTLNATDALDLVISSLPHGARVAVSALEHAAVMRPLARRQREGSAEIVRLMPGPGGVLDPGAVAAAARGAALVAVTLASNVTGVVQPVEEIAAALPAEALLLVDAAQAAGSVAFSSSRFGPRAVTCASGHKGLLGPMGCGLLVAGEDVELPSRREGGTGDGAFEHPKDMPRRLEAGTPPLPAILGLRAGIEWWISQDPSRIREREQAQLRAILDALRDARAELPGFGDPQMPRAPLASFRIPGWSGEEVAHVLETERAVTVRAGLHCAPWAHESLGTWPEGLVRVSVGPTTTDADVAAFCDGVRDLVR